MNASVERATYPGLDDRIAVLRAGAVVDAVFVRAERFDLLVDTLDTPQTCRAALDLLDGAGRDRPLIVVNSHMDWDHFWGNAAVADRAVIIAHERAARRFHDPSIRETLKRMAAEDARFANLTLCPPTLAFADRLRLDGGDLTVELIPTPGHTPDHVAVWIPELKTCLAVDAVEWPIPEVWSDDPADLSALLASLRLIERLDADHVVLAHGQTDAPAVVGRNLTYFEALATRVKSLDRTATLDDASPLPAGLSLSDLLPGTASLAPPARDFYERCHRSNLKACIRSERESGR